MSLDEMLLKYNSYKVSKFKNYLEIITVRNYYDKRIY